MSMIKCVLPVLEMSCAVCANNVETTVKNLRGVQSAVVNFATEDLLLTYDPAIITLEEIAAAVEAAGYGLVVGEEEKEKQREAAATRHFKSLRNRVVVAWLFALPLMAVSMGCMHTPHIEWLLLALTLPVILYSGRDFYVHAWKQLCQRTANMDTLVALSTGVAFLFSLAMTLFPQYWKSQGIAPQVYYDAAGMIIAFVLTGKLMEERAKHNTSAALKSLMGLQPQTAMKITADGMCEVNIATLKTGDRILVRPGEKVAVDGRVVEGESYVDESMINGEPIPADKTTGDTVMAGTINRDGVLTVEAQAVGAQTVLAHIVRRVQEAQGSKAPAQRLADRVSRRFVPAIIILACLTFVGWQCFYPGDNRLAHSLLTAISVLVIACPCALGLATPTALMVGIGKAAGEHILIKDAVALEKMGQIDGMVLDKTGTLTQGRPEVVDAVWLRPEERYAAPLARAEEQSQHPLAQAIAAHWSSHAREKTFAIERYEQLSGKGIEFDVQGETLRIGNRAFMTASSLSPDLETKIASWQAEGKSIVFYGNREGVIAIIAIADKIKESSHEAIARLRKLGIEVYMLTGDDTATATSVAQAVGITRFRANALPQEKEDFVGSLQSGGKTVAMVGDGINDSQALAQADVSIAMGQGTDIAMQVAMVTLISSDLRLLSRAVLLSRRTMRIVRENLFWAFIYNIVCIPVAAGVLFPINGWLLNPMWASAAMAFSSVSVVLNSLRLKWK